MKIRGILLGTLDEQIAGGDRHPINPKLVKLEDVVPVTVGFQRDRVVGRTTRTWLEDGRILFEADVDELRDFMVTNAKDRAPGLATKGAVGISVDSVEERMPTTAELAYTLESKDFAGYTIKGGRLFEVGLTDENENRNQPPWEIVEDKEG
jgi:hypothetical protein